MLTWESLGIKRQYMEKVAKYNAMGLDRWWEGPPSDPDGVAGWIFDVHIVAANVFAMASIGYPMPNPPLDDWREVSRRLISACIYYFYGPWRDKFKYFRKEYNRQSARTKLDWIDAYRYGLVFALCLSDWESADQLLQWPGPDLSYDEGVCELTEQDQAYHIWLASRLRGEPESASSQQRAMIEDGTRRRPKMLLAAADAMFAGDTETFLTALEKYLRHYKKREFITGRGTDFGFCIEASILWHLARRREMELKPFAEDIDIFIPKP